MKITSLKAKEIKDSRGNPTVEVEVCSGDVCVKASVPSGTSTGSREVRNLPAEEATKKVNEVIAPKINGSTVEPLEIDKVLFELDGTKDKSNLGANAMLGVSLAVTRLGAKLEDKPLWQYINEISGVKVEPNKPKLFMNVINGGAHANFNSPFQEYIVIADDYEKAKVLFEKLGDEIKEKYGEVEMGDEGGYSPKTENIEAPFELISELLDGDMRIAIDSAGSEFYEEGNYKILEQDHSSDELLTVYKNLVEKYPLSSIEDPFAENDVDAFSKMTRESRDWNLKCGCEMLVVGDDLTTTNPESILESARNKRVNAIIIKPNQIGTLTEVYTAVRLARGAGWKIICSHRSGETMDSFIADLAVGIGAYGIKAGAPTQEVRRVKYERLVEIEKEL
ncbi:phosphopyruvate hydratase [Patescibacteria group bacterium]|nr:phosphopyruvate hydratase [Patescibacteria group bacterium]